mmetsp:Transcript_37922/g.76627  ORF Transcript_37922/g.76627 Transcript_37922/m.76627 type:complete len:306 (-) Transcript_37922:367-1284(-)
MGLRAYPIWGSQRVVRDGVTVWASLSSRRLFHHLARLQSHFRALFAWRAHHPSQSGWLGCDSLGGGVEHSGGTLGCRHRVDSDRHRKACRPARRGHLRLRARRERRRQRGCHQLVRQALPVAKPTPHRRSCCDEQPRRDELQQRGRKRTWKRCFSECFKRVAALRHLNPNNPTAVCCPPAGLARPRDERGLPRVAGFRRGDLPPDHEGLRVHARHVREGWRVRAPHHVGVYARLDRRFGGHALVASPRVHKVRDHPCPTRRVRRGECGVGLFRARVLQREQLHEALAAHHHVCRSGRHPCRDCHW